MDAKDALHAPETHPFVDGIENLSAGGLAVCHRFSVWVEAATANFTEIRLGAVLGLAIPDALNTSARWALEHPTSTSRLRSHYPFVNIVPTNVVDAFARGDMLAIIFFAVFFGLGLGALGERGKPLLNVFQLVADTMFWVTNQIMKLAPLGVFALIGVTVSKFGVQSLLPLGKLVIVVYGAMLAFVLLILGTVARFAGTSILTLIRVLRDELTLAYSTASSETVLPRIMQKMEAFGCPKYITSFVIPTGYSFNLDGSTLYQSIAALFIAQLYGIHMPLEKQVLLVLTLISPARALRAYRG